VVTGASSGIGNGCPQLRRGLPRVPRGAQRKSSPGGGGHRSGAAGGHRGGRSHPGRGVRAVYDRVMETGEGIDVLVNNAVRLVWYASDMSSATALEMIQVNMRRWRS